MKISSRTRYGLRFLLHLALNEGEGPLQLKEIAEKEKISDKYLEQIVIVLKPSGIIKSVRGSKGGYTLAVSASHIRLKDIFEKLEGSLNIVEDTPDDFSQSIETLTASDIWQALNQHLLDFLNKYTLEEIARQALTKSSQTMFYI